MKLRPITAAVLFALSVATAGASADDEVRRSYIIQLVDKPVATYAGDVAGLAATKPATGQRLNVDAAAVQNYIGYLAGKQASVAATVNKAQITNEYKVVLNGFSALLTDDEVRALKKNPEVANITADSIMQLDTSYTPTFLGLDKSGGLWEQVGGQDSAGEGMIIGIVDGGIWPEHDSFADRVDENGNPSRNGSKLAYTAPPSTWKGICQTGEGFQASDCNNKLIGARYFKQASQNLHWTEFLSPRDSIAGAEGHGGHGDHTASTAGGNAHVTAYASGLSLGKISGMAPRARIAAYKVCWTDATTAANGCATSNSVAAIEQAVKDGVNVINFSIGPNAGGGAFNEATEVAFLGAASAGVFVAASAGNSGPATAPVAHISPWLTTVANSTHNRQYVGDVTLGNGTVLTGASGNANTPSSPLILAKDAGMSGVDPANVSLNQCFGSVDGVANLLDPAKVSGKILVCDRGNNVLVNKSANAKNAGAAGVVIANVAGGATTILNQAHTVSTVHIRREDGDRLKAYIAATPGASAALGNLHGVIDPTVTAPIVNSSSSRGPNVANANIMKPDLSAPGTDILAAVSADLTRAQRAAIVAGGEAPSKDFAFYTGTSMASPHVAGVAALLKQRHPDWSPAMIKSALMTTTTDTFSDGLNGSVSWDSSARTTGTLPWGQGAGHIAPTAAADPGLVYDASEVDYIRFLCGLSLNVYSAATCSTYGTIQPYDLNLASLTAANVLGVLTMNRTVTNVGASTATYNASATLPGFTVAVTPASLTLAPGASGKFAVKLTRTSAAYNTWMYGKLVWTDGSHVVRSPLNARAAMLAAPTTVTSEATTGSKVITIGAGFSGALAVTKSGLLAPTEFNGTVVKAPSTANTVCTGGGGTGVNVHTVTVPAGATIARFALYDSDTSGNGASDLDLVVARGTTVVGTSGSDTSNEMVTLTNPAAGDYKVCVVGYAPAGGSATYKLSTWVLSPTSTGGNFKAAAAGAVAVGGTAPVALSWSGLAVGKRYLGSVSYQNAGAAVGSTIVEIDTTDPIPLFQNSGIKQVNAE
ncbi:S8 family serine peptidase [Massilia forsythiae]|uniref:S8 family serine peptidase n=1 Tax=Massilia forsythiae TaxID=2728020 RepID=A0A7Z2VX77_9BURK|nr:S8 family serine peptidase [Massilia forsythiae]QJE00783.1 S8 family serine peptidase [Massilia forsythiae]